MKINKRILFVDDDENILSSLTRNLRSKFEITTASSPFDGIKILKNNIRNPFAVIVSDLKMPKMSGLEFLSAVRQINKNSVRVMLTGYADVDNAISAINDGHIFKFLIKPCPPHELIKVLDSCIEQYKLKMTEKELLKETLQGSIKLLTDILSLSNQKAYEKSERIKTIVKQILKIYPVKDAWQVEIAAMLSQIGCFALTNEIFEKVINNRELTTEEQKIYETHPHIGASLIKNIPRLEPIAEIIELQNVTDPHLKIPEGAKILNIAIYYDEKTQAGFDIHHILTELNKNSSFYGAKLIKAFENSVNTEKGYLKRALNINELTEGMRLDQDVITVDNLLLLKNGQELTQANITRLKNYGKSCGVKEPIKVLVPKN